MKNKNKSTMLSSGQLFTYDRFEPPGVSYKGKLIGVESVQEARGDQMCQEAMGKLKAMIKISGEHKQRVILNVSTAGVRVLDEKTMNEEHLFEVQKISFVSRDPTDARAFGMVAGDEGNHKFLGIKTEKQAYNVVMALKELFETVLKSKQREIEQYQGNKSDGQKVNSGAPTPSSTTAKSVEPLYAQPQKVQSSSEEDPSSLYATVNKNPPESLAELAQQVEHMQEGLTNMEEIGDFSLPSPGSNPVRQSSSSTLQAAAPMSPTPEINLADAQAAADASHSSDPFASSLFETQAQPAASSGTSASNDLFREFGDAFSAPAPAPVQPPPQQSNPFGSTAGFGATPSIPPRYNQQQQYATSQAFQQPFQASFQQPSYQQPSFQQPSYQQPSYQQPMFQQPAFGSSSGNPFGDQSSNNGDMFGGAMIQPENVAPSLTKEEPKQPDPFAGLGLLGEKPPAKSGKDMFSGFKMAKPGQVTVPELHPGGLAQTSGEHSSPSSSSTHHETCDTQSLDSYDNEGSETLSHQLVKTEEQMTLEMEKNLSKFDGLDHQAGPDSESGFEESMTIESQSSESDFMNDSDHKSLPTSLESDSVEKFQLSSQSILIISDKNIRFENKNREAFESIDSEAEKPEESIETSDKKVERLPPRNGEEIEQIGEKVQIDGIDSDHKCTSLTPKLSSSPPTSSLIFASSSAKNEITAITFTETKDSQLSFPPAANDPPILSKNTDTSEVQKSSNTFGDKLNFSNLILASPSPGSPALGPLALGPPALGSPAVGSPAIGSPALSSPSLGSPPPCSPPPGSPPPLPEDLHIPSPEFSPPPLPKGFVFTSSNSQLFDFSPDTSFGPPPVPKRVPQVEVDRGGTMAPPPPPPPPRRPSSKSECSSAPAVPRRPSAPLSSSLAINRSNWARFDDCSDERPPTKTESLGSIDSAWQRPLNWSANKSSEDVLIVHASHNSHLHSDKTFDSLTSSLQDNSSAAHLSSNKETLFKDAFDFNFAKSHAPSVSHPQSISPPTIRQNSDPFSDNFIVASSQEQYTLPASLSSAPSSFVSSKSSLTASILPVHDDPFADDPFVATSHTISKPLLLANHNSLSSPAPFNTFSSNETTDPFGFGAEVNSNQSKQLTTSTGIPLLSDDPFEL